MKFTSRALTKEQPIDDEYQHQADGSYNEHHRGFDRAWISFEPLRWPLSIGTGDRTIRAAMLTVILYSDQVDFAISIGRGNGNRD